MDFYVVWKSFGFFEFVFFATFDEILVECEIVFIKLANLARFDI